MLLFIVIVSTLTVDGIITKWENQLRKDVEEYQRQSERVAMWDQQLRENQKVEISFCLFKYHYFS